MALVPFYVSFLFESVERLYTVRIVDDDDLLTIWELIQEPSSFCRYHTSLDPRNVVWILKVLVVRLASVLLGDHYEIVFARVLTVIDVSLSQLSDLFPSPVYLLVFGANLTLELPIVMFELSSIFLSFRQIVVKLVDRLLLFRDGFLVLFLNLLDTLTNQPFARRAASLPIRSEVYLLRRSRNPSDIGSGVEN